MPDRATPSEDLFVVPRADGEYYLYAPLRRCVAVVNGAAVDAVAQYLAGGEGDVNPGAAGLIRTLTDRGLIGAPEPSPPTFPDDYGFCPHEVTLFPTSRCNLRCRYCYADAGRKAVEMPWPVARAAIDMVAANAGELGNRSFSVGFHGGGEPTVAWPFLVRCVEHSRRKADELL